ncbi:MAG: reductase [Propionibacteriales bacterium]|nr:reductase [Propionibacteriales bacterium]
MRILVLGGTAWLGSSVINRALARGHQVTALARGESGETPVGARFVSGDRRSTAGYDDLEGTFDAAIDVARDPLHVQTALDVLGDRVRHWVFVSSTSVYARPDTVGSDETAEVLPPLTGDWKPELYGAGKVACERLLTGVLGQQRTFVARSGLIAGPGDSTDRTGYWPLRFAHRATPDGRVLVPHSPDLATQVLDVRDLSAWLILAAEQGITGTHNASAPSITLAEHLATARQVAGYTSPLVPVDQEWLATHEVQPWAGPRSLPLWLPVPRYAGLMSHSVASALAAGLRIRPLTETLTDTLAWEVQRPADRQRAAGLTVDEERELIKLARRAS